MRYLRIGAFAILTDLGASRHHPRGSIKTTRPKVAPDHAKRRRAQYKPFAATRFIGGIPIYLLHRLSGVDGRVFRKREIVIRSTNGVRYIILVPAFQRAVAVGLVVLAVGATWTVAGYRHACRLADRAQLEIARVEEAHRLAVERRVADVEKAADAGRAEGIAPSQELAARNEMLRRRLNKMEQGLARAESESTRAAALHESLVERLRLLDLQVRGAVAPPIEVGMLLWRADPGAVETAGRDP